MKILAWQPYIKIDRKVDRTQQTETKQERMMYLFEDKIVTKHHEFAIEEVRDMSYRQIGTDENGLLYLHTSHGVYPYTVNTSPSFFIQQFKGLTDRNLHS